MVRLSTCQWYTNVGRAGSGGKMPPNTSFFATIVSVPPRWLAGGARAVTHVRSADAATACGTLSVAVVESTCSELASIRTSEGGWPTATQTAPFVYATPSGLPPTGICRLWSVAGSMLVTVPSAAFATHTRPPPNAIATGLFPTDSRATTCGFVGSTLTTELELVSVTHTQPPPNATATGAPPIAIGTDGLRLASIRCNVPSVALTTHADPSPYAIALGPCPTVIGVD